MCVAALAWHAHPRWKLVAIGNRDEYHDRPAAPLARWDDGSGIVAGCDLVGGGTWLGVSEAGRFALITNRRGFGDPDPARRSRGELVTALLTGDDPPAALDAYNPFNLFASKGDRLEYLTNRPDRLRTTLGHGLYGLSNGALDEPWPKTLALKAALTDWLNLEDDDIARLFAILASEDRPALGLPPSEASDIPVEPADTPPFIRSPLYGTRCSTVVTVDRDGAGKIVERRFSAAGEDDGQTMIAFAWPVPA
jgi:uncharacterized protein with NRDE domain